MTLVEFLEERLAEGEEMARRPTGLVYACDDGHVEVPVDEWADGSDRLPNHHNTWAVVHDPARVLREVEAKRRIVALHAPHPDAEFWGGHPETPEEGSEPTDGIACATCGIWAEYGVPWPCRTLRALASVYSDHPDFQEEWGA